MEDQNIRRVIQAKAEDCDLEIKILTNHSYDKSIIGITEEGRVIYSFNKMVQEFKQDEHCSEEEAIEWITVNTIPALPYMGENYPIIVMDDIESLFEKYL